MKAKPIMLITIATQSRYAQLGAKHIQIPPSGVPRWSKGSNRGGIPLFAQSISWNQATADQ